MKINVVCEERNHDLEHQWILRRSAEELQSIDNLTLNSNEPCEINYFINYALYKPLAGINIGHFTHLETDGDLNRLFKEVAIACDYATCTCEITKDILTTFIPRRNIFIIPYGSDDRLKKDIVFGVVGRVYPSKRKGEIFVKMMVDAGYNVKAWGYGWDEYGCKDITNKWDQLLEFYQSIDYLVVTSINEGGPVSVIDSMRAGVPVIAPDVGWCWEFPVIKYDKGDWDSLDLVLTTLTKPPQWSGWTDMHTKMFNFIETGKWE